MPERGDFQVTTVENGFQWGPAKILRTASFEDYGACIRVMGKHELVDIRITKGGWLRISPIQKTKKGRQIG